MYMYYKDIFIFNEKMYVIIMRINIFMYNFDNFKMIKEFIFILRLFTLYVRIIFYMLI